MLEVLTRGLAREFGRPSFSPLLTEARSVTPIVMKVPSGPQVQLQLLPSNHYPAWPFHVMTLQDRYSDCGPAFLSIPTRDSFVAWKTTAFMDRRASRDLWDLAALAELDAFTPEAARLFTQFGLLRTCRRIRRFLLHQMNRLGSAISLIKRVWRSQPNRLELESWTLGRCWTSN